MSVHAVEFEVATRGRGFTELTHDVAAAVRDSGIRTGLCAVSIAHTSASLVVCENADGEVLRDLERFMSRLVVDGDPVFRHDAEGPDDMPAHVRSVLTLTDVSLPVRGGRLRLGTWQGVFLWEHRTRAYRRRVTVTVLGEG
ncbi:MAG: secondary thiamine-phosphate synthase enzyme YjbQ [Gammaproteobacteria bacterium]